jgi:hypothetical protein
MDDRLRHIEVPRYDNSLKAAGQPGARTETDDFETRRERAGGLKQLTTRELNMRWPVG